MSEKSPQQKKSDIFTNRQMDGLSVEDQLAKAADHILGRICTEPHIAYRMGSGTQTFALLTEALANHKKMDLETGRRNVLEAICKLDFSEVKANKVDASEYEELQNRCDELDKRCKELEKRCPPDWFSGLSLAELAKRIGELAEEASLPELIECNVYNIEVHSGTVNLS